jgi:hypothetical protein
MSKVSIAFGKPTHLPKKKSLNGCKIFRYVGVVGGGLMRVVFTAESRSGEMGSKPELSAGGGF